MRVICNYEHPFHMHDDTVSVSLAGFQIRTTPDEGLPPPGAVAKTQSAGSALALDDGQVLVELPLGDLHTILVPLLALVGDVEGVDMLAQNFLHERGVLEQVDRLA
jgi:hypothetical protein